MLVIIKYSCLTSQSTITIHLQQRGHSYTRTLDLHFNETLTWWKYTLHATPNFIAYSQSESHLTYQVWGYRRKQTTLVKSF